MQPKTPRSTPRSHAAVPRNRRALSHVGGATEVWSDNAELGALLRSALDVRSDEDAVLAHVHGFHSYPARMHPDTARALVAGLSAERDAVLDPFCGSGTLPVSARALGRRVFGSDLNPLAVELARLKTRNVNDAFLRELDAGTARVVAHAHARQKAEAGPTHLYSGEDIALFSMHILLALDGLHDGIFQVENIEVRRALLLVLSAALTKFSNKRGDSGSGTDRKRISRSYPLRFFELKAHDLSKRLAQYASLVPQAAPAARIEVSDARKLWYLPERSVSLVVSSPPYPGVYDYFEHHALRLRWLGLEASAFEESEIGSRRAARDTEHSPRARWEADFGRCLAEIARVLEPDGRAALLLADSVVANSPYYVDDWLPRLASRHGFALKARASQARPHFHGPTSRAFERRPRREHLLLLGRV